jgi:hypothetical protein
VERGGQAPADGHDQAVELEHGQHGLADPGELGHGGGLGAAFQVEQAVQLPWDVGELGDAPATEVVVAAEHLGLEAVGQALVALGAGDQFGVPARR